MPDEPYFQQEVFPFVFFVVIELCPYHTVVPDMIKLTALGPGISKGSTGAGEFRFEGCRERLRKRSTTALGE